ncbi:MAG: transporter [Rhodospirillales bacterium]|nr:transporter [Rhodospirillales bacterium]
MPNTGDAMELIVITRPKTNAASRGAVLLAAAVALGGCALETARPASGITPPAEFVMAGAGGPRSDDPAWWRGFGAPTLDRLMGQSMAANQDIAIAVARLRQADAFTRITGAGLLPLVDADGSVQRSRSTNRNLGSSGQAGNAFGASLSASWEIDFWGRLQSRLESARSNALANAYNIGAVTLSTQSSVANGYFAYLGATARLAIQRENLRAAENILVILRQRLEAGTATGLDVAQQEVVVAQQRASAPPLQQSAEQNSFALATLSGGLPALLTPEDPPLRALRVPTVVPGLPSELLLRRPDVRLAEASLVASNFDVTAARAALFPRITLTGSGGIQSLALETLLRPGSVLYNLAAGVTQPIFDGGALRAQVEQARGLQEENLASYRRSILAALEDTETSLSALRRTSELVVLQEAREAAARRAFEIADAQLRAGTIDLLTVLNTQTTLFSARDALALAVTQRLQAAASLFTALGGGWTMPEGRITR